MPRIWMSYIELAELLSCSPMEARDYAIMRSLVRRKSRSGITWTELDGQLTLAFIDRMRDPSYASSPETELDQAITELQDIHEEMSRLTAPAPLRKRV